MIGSEMPQRMGAGGTSGDAVSVSVSAGEVVSSAGRDMPEVS
jgi:hypothetical protein